MRLKVFETSQVNRSQSKAKVKYDVDLYTKNWRKKGLCVTCFKPSSNRPAMPTQNCCCTRFSDVQFKKIPCDKQRTVSERHYNK